MKVLELQSRMQFQEETIKALENKLSENEKRLQEKDRMLSELHANKDRSKTCTVSNQPIVNFNINGQKLNPTAVNEPYLTKRINDL